MEDATEQHGLRVGFRVGVGMMHGVVRVAPVAVGLLDGVRVGVGATSSALGATISSAVIVASTDVFALSEDVDVHFTDGNGEGVGVDGAHEEIQHQFLLASQDVLDSMDLDVLQRSVASENKEDGGNNHQDKHDCCEYTCTCSPRETPQSVASTLEFVVVHHGVACAVGESRDMSSRRPYSSHQRRSFIICVLFCIEVVGVLLLSVGREKWP